MFRYVFRCKPSNESSNVTTISQHCIKNTTNPCNVFNMNLFKLGSGNICQGLVVFKPVLRLGVRIDMKADDEDELWDDWDSSSYMVMDKVVQKTGFWVILTVFIVLLVYVGLGLVLIRTAPGKSSLHTQ